MKKKNSATIRKIFTGNIMSKNKPITFFDKNYESLHNICMFLPALLYFLKSKGINLTSSNKTKCQNSL